MWPAQEGGAIYCKCLSDAIQPPLSKTEFIQEALVASRKMPSLWMYTHQTTRLETRGEQARPTENIPTNGEERSWLPAIQQGYFWGWPLRQECLTCYHHCFINQEQGDFFSAYLWKHFLKMWASGLEPGTLGIISNLATVTIKEISATEQKEEYCNLKSETERTARRGWVPHKESGTEKCSTAFV